MRHVLLMSDNRAQVLDAVAKMQTDEGYFTYGAIVWDALTPTQREVLKQLLFQGPVWDGNIISKSARNDLFEFGLAARCCFMGEQGYAAATYDAYSVFEQGKGQPLPKKPGTPG